MFDRRSYLDTISALRADPDKLEEIIKMKENDRRHIPHSLRPVAAVAAALAGAWIATALDVELLRRPFGVYLLLSGVSLLWPQKRKKT